MSLGTLMKWIEAGRNGTTKAMAESMREEWDAVKSNLPDDYRQMMEDRLAEIRIIKPGLVVEEITVGSTKYPNMMDDPDLSDEELDGLEADADLDDLPPILAADDEDNLQYRMECQEPRAEQYYRN